MLNLPFYEQSEVAVIETHADALAERSKNLKKSDNSHNTYSFWDRKLIWKLVCLLSCSALDICACSCVEYKLLMFHCNLNSLSNS